MQGNPTPTPESIGLITGTTGLAILATATQAEALAAIGAEQEIEIITNANGTAYRFASGLQICLGEGVAQNVSIALGGVAYSSVVETWTYPSAFNSPPRCSGSVQGSLVRWMTFNSSETAASYVQYRGAVDSTLVSSTLLAIGTYAP